MAEDSRDLFRQFIDKFQDELKGMGHVNLIISGKTGVGKSTLLNAAFREDLAATGVGEPVTPEIRMYQDSKKQYPLRIYDTMALSLAQKDRNMLFSRFMNCVRRKRQQVIWMKPSM